MAAKSRKAKIVTEDYVLEKFVDLLDSDAPWAVKVRGLEQLGKYLNMFADQKKVDISVRSLVTGASIEELRKLAGEAEDMGQNSRMRYLGLHHSDNCRSDIQPDGAEREGDCQPEGSSSDEE